MNLDPVLYIEYYNKTFVKIRTLNLQLYKKITPFFEHRVEVFDRKTYRKKKVLMSLIQDSCYIYTGLMYQFLLYLDEGNIQYTLDDRIQLRYHVDDKKIDYFIEKLNPRFTPRPHQLFAFKEVLRQSNGTILSSTSSGKSLIAYLLINYYRMINVNKKKILLLVPTSGLVEQMYGDFIDYSCNNDKVNIPDICQKVHSKVKDKDLSKEVIISTWQSEKGTTKKMVEQFGIDFLHNVGLLIFDEVHGAKAIESRKIITNCANVDIKCGMTGTLFDDEDEKDVFNNRLIEGLTGEIIEAISASEMIDLNYSAKLKIYNCILEYGDRDKLNYTEEMLFIHDHIGRMNWIADKFSMLKGNQLVLFKTKSYGKTLANLFRSRGKRVLYVDGDTSPKERNDYRKIAETNENLILLFSYGTSSTGVSINNIKFIIFAQEMKSKIKVIQSIGRGLRKHKNKNEVIVFDIVDMISYSEYKGYAYQHFEYRTKLYTKEKYPFEIKYIKKFD